LQISDKGADYRSMMRRIIIFFLLLGISDIALTQAPDEFVNSKFLKKLNKDRSYSDLKKKIISDFKGTPPGKWGEFVKGVDEDLDTKNKIIAFTFDACGGKKGNGYDKDLIDFLHQEKIPATLFISGRWIDSQFDTFLILSRDTLFEIENHGLNHRPCSIDGESAYGIRGTSDIEDAFDEIEANTRKIEAITGHRPRFYRSATAYIDEACASMAARLGMTTVSFQVLSGDAIPFAPETEIEKNVVNKIKPGVVVIMHLNHPEWNTREAMQKIVPVLRQKGYTFARLKDFKLIEVKNKERISVKSDTNIKVQPSKLK
jgi:peptidoglycan/xylan/chitin deacetylase (PgdA/CDA1 family)